MRLALTTCLAAFGAAIALPAAAQEIPDMVGTWKGKATAVYIGPNPYRLPDGDRPTFGDNEVEFTYVIKEQRDSRFAGETEGSFTETLIGALQAPDFQSGLMLDDDGEYPFTLRDGNTVMDFCYRHQYPTSKVVSCFTIEKQP
jgi:hypothetical protein